MEWNIIETLVAYRTRDNLNSGCGWSGREATETWWNANDRSEKRRRFMFRKRKKTRKRLDHLLWASLSVVSASFPTFFTILSIYWFYYAFLLARGFHLIRLFSCFYGIRCLGINNTRQAECVFLLLAACFFFVSGPKGTSSKFIHVLCMDSARLLPLIEVPQRE